MASVADIASPGHAASATAALRYASHDARRRAQSPEATPRHAGTRGVTSAARTAERLEYGAAPRSAVSYTYASTVCLRPHSVVVSRGRSRSAWQPPSSSSVPRTRGGHERCRHARPRRRRVCLMRHYAARQAATLAEVTLPCRRHDVATCRRLPYQCSPEPQEKAAVMYCACQPRH